MPEIENKGVQEAERLRKAAEQENVDYRKVVRWFRKEAEQGNVWAKGFLGLMHVEEYGVREDAREAVRRFHRAEAQN